METTTYTKQPSTDSLEVSYSADGAEYEQMQYSTIEEAMEKIKAHLEKQENLPAPSEHSFKLSWIISFNTHSEYDPEEIRYSTIEEAMEKVKTVLEKIFFTDPLSEPQFLRILSLTDWL